MKRNLANLTSNDHKMNSNGVATAVHLLQIFRAQSERSTGLSLKQEHDWSVTKNCAHMFDRLVSIEQDNVFCLFRLEAINLRM